MFLFCLILERRDRPWKEATENSRSVEQRERERERERERDRRERVEREREREREEREREREREREKRERERFFWQNLGPALSNVQCAYMPIITQVVT